MLPSSWDGESEYVLTSSPASPSPQGGCILISLRLVAAPLAGRISDMIVVRYRARRGGVWYPEDRIRGTLVGALIIVPVSIIGSGIVTTYVEDRKVGLALNLVCLFLNGFGVSHLSERFAFALQHWWVERDFVFQVDVVLSPCAAYIVDVMHSRSAEIMAANK
jgi:MFS family permease